MREIRPERRKLAAYKKIIPEDLYWTLREKAKHFRSLSVAHVNATALGGGVVEILTGLVPLLNDLGIKTSWYVIPPNDEFFEVTKFLHNALQGREGQLTRRQQAVYLSHTAQIAKEMARLSADIWVIHDPQPLGVISILNGAIKPAVWRCHIDLTKPNREVWNFLSPYVKEYDRYIFSMPGYVAKELPKERVSIFTPTIDPLSPKNRLMDKKDAQKIIARFGIDPQRPLVTQVSRFDPWKDPEGVIQAYRMAKEEIPDLQLAYVAQMAPDDPEGQRVYKKMKVFGGQDPDLHLLANLPNNDVAINAFQTASGVILQKSIREGFGLTVTEAMWKGTPVVGGDVGGIAYQIQDGINGFLVRSPAQCADRLVELLKNDKLAEGIGQNAHLWVKKNFLLPRLVLNWLNIFDRLTKKTKKERALTHLTASMRR